MMIDLLDDAQNELKTAIFNINWEDVSDSFTSNQFYIAENKKISEDTEGGSINYSFGDYLLHHPSNSNNILECINRFLFRAQNLIVRDEQVHKQYQILIPIEEKFRVELSEWKNHIETRFQTQYKELQFTLLDMFENKFVNIKNYEQLVLSIIDSAHQNKYEVFRWKGAQADLFRYVKLAIDLELIEDDKVEISEFLRKHVLCKNKKSNEYQPIVLSELKNTFYSGGRNRLDEKFIKKLKKTITAKYPD